MSNALQMAAERAPDPCPACGETITNGRRPNGYGQVHCQDCAAEIEQRHGFHSRRNGGGR